MFLVVCTYDQLMSQCLWSILLKQAMHCITLCIYKWHEQENSTVSTDIATQTYSVGHQTHFKINKLLTSYVDFAFILFFISYFPQGVRIWFVNSAPTSKVLGVPHKTTGLFLSFQNKSGSLAIIRTLVWLKADWNFSASLMTFAFYVMAI